MSQTRGGGAPPLAPPEATLPKKLHSTFRQMLKLYEERKNRKALKLAEQILKQAPNHGETVSTRALISFLTPNGFSKGEAFEEAKKGLRLAIKSPTCWHILGLLHRNEKEYSDAVKYFKQALQLEPSNLMIARDLATLLVHTHQFEALCELRKSQLHARPELKVNWSAYAFALHMTGHYSFAAHLVRSMRRQFHAAVPVRGEERWERSELILYEAQIREEGGDYEAAIECLTSNASAIVDSVGLYQTLGRLNIYLKHWDKAHEAYLSLCKRLKFNDKMAVLLALSTAPEIRDSVIFPLPPRGPFSLVHTAGPTSATKDVKLLDRPDDHSYHSDATAQEAWLELSLYALKSPTLYNSASIDWPRQPPAFIFGSFKNSANSYQARSAIPRCPSPDDCAFQQIRRLTDGEETAIISWVASSIAKMIENTTEANTQGDKFTVDGVLNADPALRLILEFIAAESKYFPSILELILRPKLLKGSFFTGNVIKNLVVNNPVKGEIAIDLLRRYHEEVVVNGNLNSLAPLQGCDAGHLQALEKVVYNLKTTDSAEDLPRSKTIVSVAEKACLGAVVTACRASLKDSQGDPEAALELINPMCEVLPTVPEICLLQARFLKHLGRRKTAAHVLMKGRELDLQDRFINTKAIKYLLEVDDYNKTNDMAIYFTPANNLVELQNMKLELRRAQSLYRQRKYGEALKQLHFILQQVQDIRSDLFDFHVYCQRRGAFRAYIDTMRMKARIYAHAYYRAAATLYIEILLLDENTKLQSLAQDKHEVPSKKQPAQKKEKVKEPEAAGKPKSQLESIDGNSLLLTSKEEAVAECLNLCANLRQAAAVDPQVNSVCYTVARAAQKPFMQLQALYRIWSLVGKDVFHPFIVPFLFDFLSGKTLENADRKFLAEECLVEILSTAGFVCSGASITGDAYAQALVANWSKSALTVPRMLGALQAISLCPHETIVSFIKSSLHTLKESRLDRNHCPFSVVKKIRKLAVGTVLEDLIGDWCQSIFPSGDFE